MGEDIIRAKFFKVFGGEDQDMISGEANECERKVKKVFNLFDNCSENVAQKFINKYYELEQITPISCSEKRNVFRETVEALELKSIDLLNPCNDIGINQQ